MLTDREVHEHEQVSSVLEEPVERKGGRGVRGGGHGTKTKSRAIRGSGPLWQPAHQPVSLQAISHIAYIDNAVQRFAAKEGGRKEDWGWCPCSHKWHCRTGIVRFFLVLALVCYNVAWNFENAGESSRVACFFEAVVLGSKSRDTIELLLQTQEKTGGVDPWSP